MRLLERCDAIRKPERFADVLLACECDAKTAWGLDAAHPQRPRLLGVLAAVQSVVTRHCSPCRRPWAGWPATGGQLIHQARIEAVAQWLHSDASPPEPHRGSDHGRRES